MMVAWHPSRPTIARRHGRVLTTLHYMETCFKDVFYRSREVTTSLEEASVPRESALQQEKFTRGELADRIERFQEQLA